MRKKKGKCFEIKIRGVLRKVRISEDLFEELLTEHFKRGSDFGKIENELVKILLRKAIVPVVKFLVSKKGKDIAHSILKDAITSESYVLIPMSKKETGSLVVEKYSITRKIKK